MAIRVPGSDPAEWLQLELPGLDPPHDALPSDPAAIPLARSALAGAGGAVGAALAVALAGALAAVGAALAAAWAALAVVGLGLGAAAGAAAAALHGASRAWSVSAPRRTAARRGLLSAGRATVTASSVGAVLAGRALATGTVTAGRALGVAADRAGRGAVTAGRGAVVAGRWGVVALVGARRLTRRRPVRLGALAVSLILFAAWPGRTAAGVVSAALQAHGASLTLPPLAQGSDVYDAHGQVVGVFHADDNRHPVALSSVSPAMVNAVVDTEDARFWSHGGVDLRAVLRALRADVGAGSARQGASTLAEQLVKNVLLAGRPDNLRTKVQEAVLADRLEGRIGKRRVLADYLNTVYFGEGAYGVQAAAETYFGVAASHLNADQAALLAGLIQDPNGYDPLRHPRAAAARRGTVLQLMVKAHHLGAHEATADAAAALPTTVNLPPSSHGWYLDAVEQELLADPRLGPTRQARYHALYYGGLRIHTALDPTLQAEATRTLVSGLPASNLQLSAALVTVDPATGRVRAVVGGPDYSASQFDAAVNLPGRQTGSAFKVFTLVAALEAGYSPADFIDGSAPCRIPNPGGTPDPWVLDNYESENFGAIDLSTAIAKSVNCAFGRLAVMVGPPKIAQVAHRMGVTAPLAAVPSMTLGTNDVPPVQMAAAYATLADDGVYHRPHLVTEVDGRDGRARLREDTSGVQVVSPQVARETVAMLQQVVLHGTGTSAAIPGRQVAGKTGTTEQYQDAWFVGFTPQLATAVWMGDLTGEVPMTNVGGIAVAGGTYPAQMWAAFMSAALGGQPAQGFTPPDPGQIPPGTSLQLGRPRPGTGSGGGSVPGVSGPGPSGGGGSGSPGSAPGSSTMTTTWCWSSCGH